MIFMSNNQWKCDGNSAAWAEKGEDCSAEGRVDGLVRAYTAVMPDLLGLQEVSVRMAGLMMTRMEWVTCEDGSTARFEYVSGGDTPIVYRRDRLRLLESGFFLYPEEIPGIGPGYNNGETKSYCFGVFEDRRNGARVAFMSTHLWWMSSHPESKSYRPRSNEARAWQMNLACARMEDVIARYECPGVILGDFNASVNSLCLDAARGRGWVEAHDIADGFADPFNGHHFCYAEGWKPYDPQPYEKAIDHIIVKNTGRLKIHDYRRVTESYFDSLSDHYPLYITADLTV